jgi:hypothetical protein
MAGGDVTAVAPQSHLNLTSADWMYRGGSMSLRVGMLACVVLLFGGPNAHADTAMATVTVGDLTFNYKTASWLMEIVGDGLVATCVHEDCRGTVVDITQHPDETLCTREAMAAEADRAFPNAGRSYENILPAGRFVLVLAERHVGRELSSPEFAYGCVAWQGSEYRFAMRPETVGTQSWIGGALHYLVSRATAHDTVVETVRVGDVDFHVSTEVWRISDALEGGTVLLTCRAPTCHEPVQLASLSARSPVEACPDLLDAVEDNGGMETRIWTLPAESPDGLTFTISETFLGCRNYVPPRIEACAIEGDRSYHLSTIGSVGCRSSIWEIPEEALTVLMKGARVVR